MTDKRAVAGDVFLRNVEIFQDLAAEKISELVKKVHFREVAAGRAFY